MEMKETWYKRFPDDQIYINPKTLEAFNDKEGKEPIQCVICGNNLIFDEDANHWLFCNKCDIDEDE